MTQKHNIKRYVAIFIALVLIGTGAFAMPLYNNENENAEETVVPNDKNPDDVTLCSDDAGETDVSNEENPDEITLCSDDAGETDFPNDENPDEITLRSDDADITYVSDTVTIVSDSSGIMELLADTWNDDEENTSVDTAYEDETDKNAAGENPADDSGESDRFDLKRLVLISDSLYDDYDASEILYYDKYDEYVLQFDTAEDAEAAYYEIVDLYGEEYCFPDEPLSSDALWEADYGSTIDTVTDIEPGSYDTWGASYMGMDYLKAQIPYTNLDSQISIAVIDSGLDTSDAKFDGRVDYSTSCYIFKENDIAVSNYDFSDGLGHGTHVSGIIADCTPDNVRLMVVKAFDDDGSSSALAITTAMQYAIENNASIINMSLGWFSENAAGYTFLDSIISEAKNSGIVICAAAGNQAGDVIYAYPAHNEDVFTVTAITSSGYFATSYSNYGNCVDFCAPGTSVYNTYKNGTKASVSGTSMATPHVSSAVAYVMLAEPQLSVDEIENLLKSYAVDLGDEGWDEKYGYGCIVLNDYYNNLKLPLKETKIATAGDAEIKEPENPDVKFEYHSLVKDYLDTGVKNRLLTNSDGNIAYSSSDTSVATVDQNGNVTIKGKGSCKITASVSATDNYKESSLSYSLTVTPHDMSDCYIEISTLTYYYTGAAIKPSIKIRQSQKSSYISSSCYTVLYDNNKEVGTGTISVIGKGNYTGEAFMTFNITLAPTGITSLKNSKTGVSIGWNKVTGATGYIVYRKTVSGQWARLKVISDTNTVTYTDTTAVSGTGYYYLVRPVRGSTLGGYSNYKLIKRLSQPTFTRVNTASGIYLSWLKVNGAGGYMIYRKVENATSWTLIKTVSASTLSYTDKAVSIGKKYTYTVKAYSGNYYSSWHAGASMYRMTGRTVYYGSNNVKGSLYLKWYSDNYVSGYQVAYSVYSDFRKFKYVTVPGNKVNYTTLKNLSKGRYYYIKVRSYRKVSGVTYCSNWGNAYKIYISK